MKYIVFHREDNKFDDIVKDSNLTNKYKTKMRYTNHLILGFTEENDDSAKILSYVFLKYGDDIKDFNKLVVDRSPVMNVDYTPKRK